MKPVPSKIIYQAIALYRGNFIQFFWLSLRSAMWAFVSVASFLISIVGLFSWPIFEFLAPPSLKIPEDARYLVVLILSVILTFVLFVFASAQVELKTASIGRLAYQHSIAQPESLAPIADVVKARFWHFWMAEVYIGVILAAVNRLIDRWIYDPIWSILLETFLYILISGQYFLTSISISVDLDTAVLRALLIPFWQSIKAVLYQAVNTRSV